MKQQFKGNSIVNKNKIILDETHDKIILLLIKEITRLNRQIASKEKAIHEKEAVIYKLKKF